MTAAASGYHPIPNEVRELAFTLENRTAVISTAGRNLVSIEKRYYVYLLTNWNHRVMYVGVTNDLRRRLYEHQDKLVKGFTEKYNVNKLVYYEETNDVTAAIAREKEIKKWRREKKNKLVFGVNPEWNDLSDQL